MAFLPAFPLGGELCALAPLLQAAEPMPPHSQRNDRHRHSLTEGPSLAFERSGGEQLAVSLLLVAGLETVLPPWRLPVGRRLGQVDGLRLLLGVLHAHAEGVVIED